jgi:hypothetical protein
MIVEVHTLKSYPVKFKKEWFPGLNLVWSAEAEGELLA